MSWPLSQDYNEAIQSPATNFADAERVAAASEGLGGAMSSLEARKLPDEQLLAHRGL